MPRTNPLGSVIDIVGAFRPVDLQTAGGQSGDWVNLKNSDGVLVVFHSAIGTAGDDPTLNINQATDNAGAGSKDLSIPTTNRTYKKQAATNLLSTGQWSDADSDISAGNWTNTDSAEQEALVTVWIDASDLDVDGGFDHIQATVADVGGNAQLGACYYILLPKYPNSPNNVVSPL